MLLFSILYMSSEHEYELMEIEDVKKDEKIINITELSGSIEGYVVKDKSSFETIIIEKENFKKLPKTGC